MYPLLSLVVENNMCHCLVVVLPTNIYISISVLGPDIRDTPTSDTMKRVIIHILIVLCHRSVVSFVSHKERISLLTIYSLFTMSYKPYLDLILFLHLCINRMFFKTSISGFIIVLFVTHLNKKRRLETHKKLNRDIMVHNEYFNSLKREIMVG